MAMTNAGASGSRPGTFTHAGRRLGARHDIALANMACRYAWQHVVAKIALLDDAVFSVIALPGKQVAKAPARRPAPAPQ